MTLKNRINAAKAVLSDGKSRLIVLSIAFVAILAIFVGILKIKKTSNLSSGEHSSIVTGVPDIESIPGMGNPCWQEVGDSNAPVPQKRIRFSFPSFS